MYTPMVGTPCPGGQDTPTSNCVSLRRTLGLAISYYTRFLHHSTSLCMVSWDPSFLNFIRCLEFCWLLALGPQALVLMGV